MAAKYKRGEHVRVREGSPTGHFRTPVYIQGKVGIIEGVHGHFRNPEALARGCDGLPKEYLYLIRFSQGDVWEKHPSPYLASQGPSDELLIDIYEHWLLPLDISC